MKLNSQELKERIEGKYMKFELGKVYKINVPIDQDVNEREVEFKKNGEPVKSIKFDLEIEVEGEKKIWSVSRRVLEIINSNIMNTETFNIVMTKENYNVIPVLEK